MSAYPLRSLEASNEHSALSGEAGQLFRAARLTHLCALRT